MLKAISSVFLNTYSIWTQHITSLNSLTSTYVYLGGIWYIPIPKNQIKNGGSWYVTILTTPQSISNKTLININLRPTLIVGNPSVNYSAPLSGALHKG